MDRDVLGGGPRGGSPRTDGGVGQEAWGAERMGRLALEPAEWDTIVPADAFGAGEKGGRTAGFALVAVPPREGLTTEKCEGGVDVEVPRGARVWFVV